MAINSNIKLGKTTNLLYGYNSEWLSKGTGNNALFPVSKQALKEIDITLSVETGYWTNPFISLHDTAESLLDELLPYQIVNPSDGTKALVAPSGVLMIGDTNKKEAIKNISNTLGVDLSNENYGFVLVKLERTDRDDVHASGSEGVLIHPNPARIPDELGVTDAFKKGMASLKRVKPRGSAFSVSKITKDVANSYLDFYSELGTHYLSKVTQGDVIFQVYAMPKLRFQRVKGFYTEKPNDLSGIAAIFFKQYTGKYDANENPFGYVSEYGNLLDFSQSNVLSNAIKEGDWIESMYAETTSIFAPFQDNTKVSPEILNNNYTDVTSINHELTSLTLFAEHSRKQVWRRVFKGGIIQKYQGNIQPEFVSYCSCDFSEDLQQNDTSGFLSTIATPYINTYKTAVDLSELQFVADKEVKEFTLFTNYLSNSSNKTVSIPGTDVMIVGQLVSVENTKSTSVIQLTDTAFENIRISIQNFFGVLIFTNTSSSNHFTLVDGLKYENIAGGGPNNRAYVKVKSDVRVTPESNNLPRLKSSLQFNFTYLNTSFSSFTNSKTSLRNFVREGLIWLTQIIPNDTTDFELADIRLRALDTAHIGSDTSLGTFVPLLPFSQYETQIQTILNYVNEIDKNIAYYQEQIETRKTQELLIDVGKVLNKNIIESGQLLSEYVQANITQQQNLSAYYASVIQQKQNEQTQVEATVRTLKAELNSQQAQVNTATENYKQAVSDWQTQETIKFGLNVATDLFSLGTTIAVPASSISAVKDLGLMVQRIQKFSNIVNATYKVYTDLQNGINKIQKAQEAFNNITTALTANVKWDEMSILMDQVLSTGPKGEPVDTAKANLVAAFKILVLRGKALTSASSSLQQLAREIYNQQRQQGLIDAQIKELSALNTNLKPETIPDLDRNSIDLIGLTGSLNMVRSQMLGLLADAFLYKDKALQYAYLQEPTIIASFDTLGIKGALVTQKTNTITAETQLNQYQNSTTTPISIPVQIPISELKDGRIYEFNLSPSIKQFFKYVNLRVNSVLAKVDGIKSTKSGEYLINLAYTGRPFFDRTSDRDSVTFNTLHRERTYAYKVDGNIPQFSDGGDTWSENVSPITPFSTWEISLPDTSTNKGISFLGQTVTVTLIFVVSARIHDAREFMMLASRSAALPSSADLLTQMNNKSVMNNWDVVFNMALSKINNVLASQYDDLKANTTYGGKVDVTSATQGANYGKTDIKTFSLQKFHIEYGYPKLTFLVNTQNTGRLEMLISNGTTTLGTRFVGQNNTDDKKIMDAIAISMGLDVSDVKVVDNTLQLEFYDTPTDIPGDATLQAIIQIGQVKGLVNNNNNIMSVVLDMAKGTFSANKIQIDMSDAQKVQFSEAVKAYFQENPVTFIINSLDLTNISTLADLRPNQFYFKAYKSATTENEMLQLFIQTNGREVFNYSQTFINGVPDPIPMGSECSLMINSRIMFGSVLPGSIQGWALDGINPGDTSKAWTAQFKNSSVDGNVDLSSLNHSYTPPPPPDGGMAGPTTYYTYAPKGGNPVNWDLSGMTISPNSSGMNLAYNNKVDFKFVETAKTCGLFGCTTSHNTQSTDITLSITGSLPVIIKNQDIKISMSNQNVTPSARTSGGGACGSDDLQSQVNKQLVEQIPKQITGKLNVSFSSVSVFAIQNLLFPSHNVINLKSAYVPGDLLILGDFKKKDS